MAYTQIIENLDLTSTLRLDGPEWNDTLVRNVTIHDVSGDGIFLRDVSNVRIENCTITDVTGVGVKLSEAGSTSDVVIADNTIARTGLDGIGAAQREAAGVNHAGLVISGNNVDQAGLQGSEGLLHGIYVQSSDSVIEGNTITNSLDGDGISVRSSGTVSGNIIEGAGKSGIAYYSDHAPGASETLIIEDNQIRDAGLDMTGRHAIDLLLAPGTSDAIDSVIVRGNDVPDGEAVGIDEGLATAGTSLQIDPSQPTAPVDGAVLGVAEYTGGEVISDHTPGVDQIDLRDVVSSLDYTGSDPVSDGYILLTPSGADTAVMVDSDGPSGPLPAELLVTVLGLPPSSVQPDLLLH